MEPTSRGEITLLLLAWRDGDSEALTKLIPLVYDTLRAIAKGVTYQQEGPKGIARTLQPTALVHEAYIRLIDQSQVDWKTRAQFFAIAAREMRRILIDNYRKRHTEKRGGDWVRISLAEAKVPIHELEINFLVLNESIEELALLDEQQAKIVELHFFGGHTNQDIAEVLNIGLSSVERELLHAKRWLRKKLSPPSK